MKIILLKDVPKLGKRFELKDVSTGYAINFLINKGLAITATKEALKKIEREKSVSEEERKIQDDLLLKNIAELKSANIVIKAEANPKGHLFAGIHSDLLVQEINKLTRISLSKDIIMLDKPIKTVGEHEIKIKVGQKNDVFKIKVENK